MPAAILCSQAKKDLLRLLSSEQFNICSDVQISVVSGFIQARAEALQLFWELDLLCEMLTWFIFGTELVLSLHKIDARNN